MSTFFKFYADTQTVCNKIFNDKTIDYGLSWNHFRTETIIDHIFIKLNRIRYIEENPIKVDESIKETLESVINYSIIGLILHKHGPIMGNNVDVLYTEIFKEVAELVSNKNNDYNDAWKEMFIKSFTDIMLAKIYRIRHAINHESSRISLILEDALKDIINYSIFYLSKLNDIQMIETLNKQTDEN